MRRFIPLLLLAAGCGGLGDPNVTMGRLTRSGGHFRYETESYGNVANLADGTIGGLTSCRRTIDINVLTVQPKRYSVLEVMVMRTELTAKGDRPVAYDSERPRTAAPARNHPEGSVAEIIQGRTITVHLLPQGGMLTAKCDAVVREAKRRKKGRQWENKVWANLQAMARSVLFDRHFPNTLRPDQEWKESGASVGGHRLPTTGVVTYTGLAWAEGRRCAVFETRAGKPGDTSRVRYVGWEAWTKEWIDVETGMLVLSKYQLRVEMMVSVRGKEVPREAELEGSVRLTEGAFE